MIFSNYIRSYKAEWQKLNRTGTFWICLGASAFLPLIITVAGLVMDGNDGPVDPDAWNGFIKSVFTAFTPFFFPIFMVIIVARIVYAEHRYDTWKLMETQPVPRLSLYIAKWKISLLTSLACLVGVLLFSLIGGLLLQWIKSDKELVQSHINCAHIAKVIFRYWVASWGLITIQYFLGLWNKSFALPLAAGLIATIAGSIMAGFQVWTWWPYSAPTYTSGTFTGSASGQFLLYTEWMSLLWAAIFLLLGYQLYVRKNIVKAIFSPAKRLIAAIGMLIAFVAIAAFINKAHTVSKYKATVLAGKLDMYKPVANIVVLQAPADDTVASIPVVNGSFHAMLPNGFDAGIYKIAAGNFQKEIFMGPNDSSYLDIKVTKDKAEVKISGTRVAENDYLSQKVRDDYTLYLLTNRGYDYKPNAYAAALYKVWEKELEKIHKFKTADNIKPADDFVKVQEKLFAVKLLNLIDITYPKVYALYNPNEQFKAPKKFDTIRKYVTPDDNSLLTFEDFRNYMTAKYRSASGKNDSIYFAVINKDVKSEKLKDALYYEQLKTAVEKIKDSAMRNYYLNTFIQRIQNGKLRYQILSSNSRLNSLQRGKPAHIFTAEALNGQEMILAQLANRYVLIDVWATWCGPCKQESPYFEEMAQKYTSDRLSFVALSVDEDKMAWKMEAGQKSKRVLQLWAKDATEGFMKPYAIMTIPRFMLIDPQGKIVNVNMPRPSDPEFERTLLREIPDLRPSFSFWD